MNRCFGNSTVPCNLLCRPWLDQGVVDNEPTLPPVVAGIGPHPIFHLCKGQMGSCMGHSCHVFFSTRRAPSPKDSKSDSRAQRRCSVSPLARSRAVCLSGSYLNIFTRP